MTHSLKFTAALGAALALALAAAARAQEASPISVAFNVGAATDYRYRGVSQTDNKGYGFGGADLTIESIGYAGAWISNVNFRNGTGLEYDLYAGIRPVVGPITVDLGVIRYGYSHGQTLRQTYTEWKVAPSMAVGPATVGLAYFYSDNFFVESGAANYYELNGSLPIGKTPFSVSGAIGRQQVKGPLDYTTWNLGVGYTLNSHIGFDLRYWDTDEHSFGSIYKSKLVIGIKATFP